MPEPTKDEELNKTAPEAEGAEATNPEEQSADNEPKFFYPAHGITIKADSQEEADKQLKKALKAREAKEED